jgi:hypothetical protein
MNMHQTMARVLSDVRFHELLLAFDVDLSASVRAQGCPRCRAALHSARYARKPRGVPAGLSEEYCQCLSLCCSRQGCRKRATPPSLRFLSGKVYLGALVVLVSAMRCGATPVRIAQLQALIGVSRRTVQRWRQWWSQIFPHSLFWRAAAGAFMPPVEMAQLPAALLVRFGGDAEQQLTSLLRFLAPITGGARRMSAV